MLGHSNDMTLESFSSLSPSTHFFFDVLVGGSWPFFFGGWVMAIFLRGVYFPPFFISRTRRQFLPFSHSPPSLRFAKRVMWARNRNPRPPSGKKWTPSSRHPCHQGNPSKTPLENPRCASFLTLTLTLSSLHPFFPLFPPPSPFVRSFVPFLLLFVHSF